MFKIVESELFTDWLRGLHDPIARRKIRARMTRFEAGNFGDVDPVGGKVYEAKIKGKGPGYRLYYARDGVQVIVFLCGGDKSSQSADIALAIKLWEARRIQ